MTKDQIDIEAFFGHLLDDHKTGVITREQAIGGLIEFACALNDDDFDEAMRWAEQGRKLVRDLISVEEAKKLLSRPPTGSIH